MSPAAQTHSIGASILALGVVILGVAAGGLAIGLGFSG